MMGHGGTIHWPLQLLDITPLDFFWWGYVKDRIYQTSISEIFVFKKKIQLAILTVTQQMLKNIWREIETDSTFLCSGLVK